MSKPSQPDEKRRREVESLLVELAEFQVDIKDVARKCPKDWRVRDKALVAALAVVQRDDLFHLMREKKSVPWQLLEEQVNIKTAELDENEPYIITLALILGRPYPSLQEHLELWLKTYELRSGAPAIKKSYEVV